MALIDRTPLEVGFSCLSIGAYSVGVPPTRTSEQIVEAYLDLLSLVRRHLPIDIRHDDIDVLASEANLDRSYIRNRVKHHLSGHSIAV